MQLFLLLKNYHASSLKNLLNILNIHVNCMPKHETYMSLTVYYTSSVLFAMLLKLLVCVCVCVFYNSYFFLLYQGPLR